METFFNKNLKYLTKHTDVNITRLSEKLHVTRQCVSHWVNSNRIPYIEVIIEIADIYNLTLDEIVLQDLSSK